MQYIRPSMTIGNVFLVLLSLNADVNAEYVMHY